MTIHDKIKPEDAMAPTLSQLILDSLSEIKDDIRDVRRGVENVRDDVQEVKDELGGNEGIRERLTALETRMESWENTPPSPISIRTVAEPAKKTAKETAITVGAPVGIMGVLYGAIEVAKMWLASSGK